MSTPTNFYPIMALVKAILFPILALITEWLKEQFESKIREWYAEALKTENPWDDFFLERLAFLLSIDLTKKE